MSNRPSSGERRRRRVSYGGFGTLREGGVRRTRLEDESQLERHFVIGKVLGQGSFGIVKEATRYNESGMKYAIKIINKEKAAMRLLERELLILTLVEHPHIIRLEEVLETSKKMFLVLEFCQGGELQDLFRARGHFSEEEVRIIIRRLTDAVAYMHQHDMVHRDLKLENILLRGDNSDDSLNIKLTDFGLSYIKGESNTVMEGTMMQTMCGTPLYMAPEVLKNQNYSKQCDIWSIGIIMYTLLCGRQPFCAEEEGNLYDLIKMGKVSFDEEVWTSVSSSAKDLICGMIQVNPADRMSAREILDHSWMTGDTHTQGRRQTVIDLMKEFREEEEQAAEQALAAGNGVEQSEEYRKSIQDDGKANGGKPSEIQKTGRVRPNSAAAGAGGGGLQPKANGSPRARSHGDLKTAESGGFRHSPSPSRPKPPRPGYMKPTKSRTTAIQTTKGKQQRYKATS